MCCLDILSKKFRNTKDFRVEICKKYVEIIRKLFGIWPVTLVHLLKSIGPGDTLVVLKGRTILQYEKYFEKDTYNFFMKI